MNDTERIPLRRLRFNSFEEVQQEIRTLHEQGYEQHGAWSLGQICQHLRIFFDGSVHGFKKMLPAPIRFILYYVAFKRVLKHGKMQRGIKVPSFLLPEKEAVTVDDADEVQKLQASVQEFVSHPGDYKPSPGFGKLTREEWHQLHLIHCAHHLRFLSATESS